MLESDPSRLLQRVKESLSQYGLLLHSDSRFPSLVGVVAGSPVHGSWWGHPKGSLILQVARKLEAEPEVLVAKLLSGKETYIHRPLWTPFISIATSKETWQLQKLSRTARRLLREVEFCSELRIDEFAWRAGIDGKVLGEDARQLERRLLVHGGSIHTERGFHSKILKTWSRWMEINAFAPKTVHVDGGKRDFERRIEVLNQEFGAKHKLPWIQSSHKKVLDLF